MIARRTLLGAALGAPLAACAPPATAAVRIWAMGNEAAHLPALLAGYDTAHPGAAVSVQALPWTGAHEKLLTGFAGGSLPDVAQIGNTWLAELTALGAVAPLPADAATFTADQFPAVLDTNRIGGRLMALPWYVDTRLQFVRTDLFARAGYDTLPTDWAGWKRALHAVKRAGGDGRYAILLPVNEFEQLLTLALQTGEPLLRDDDTRGNFRSAGFKAALAFYVSLFREGLAPIVSAAQIANVWTEFARGFFAAYISGPWTVADLKARLPADLTGKWATQPMPGPDGPGAAAPGGSSLVVCRTARDPAAAWQLVRHLSTVGVQARFAQLSGDLPARPSAWRAAGLAADPLMAPFGVQLARARAVPKVPEWERIVSEMQIVAEQAVRGSRTIDSAAAEIDARVDRLLEKRRWMVEKDRAA
ncbi:extracellular solute-binding protein [Sphingomonas donggukensis]|uniref:Extracellular solute-binding protein n=1 Tax=Sphingomonas donggukensis TaxID=2949093 RepID=A0ABY4TSV1_9SPHN|nr:extracellular solute-binding protein [Sphingomonas donggukensis]URW75479.1 extracellular solute-binding protein [Sphingomonas donggukensis]